jgi:hypothetical protein
VSNFISIATKLIKFIINFTLKIKFNIRKDGHFGQFKTFLKRPTDLDGTCYVPQFSKFFLEKSIKYQLKK